LTSQLLALSLFPQPGRDIYSGTGFSLLNVEDIECMKEGSCERDVYYYDQITRHLIIIKVHQQLGEIARPELVVIRSIWLEVDMKIAFALRESATAYVKLYRSPIALF
jgi:hypothetical protein